MKITTFLLVFLYSIKIFYANAENTIVANIKVPLEKFIKSIEPEKKQLQGGAIAIICQGKVLYKNTFGYGKEKKYPITSDTLFSLASVSKPVTAVALAPLVQKGEITLSDFMQVPFLKNPVNWYHILSHTTGYHFSGNYMTEKGVLRCEILPKLGKLKPSHTPGKTYFYSNVIFSLIEEALQTKEKTLGAILSSYNKSIGFDGLQTLDMNPSIKIAFPHTKKNKQVIALPFPPYYPKSAPAAAGIFASINGLIEVLKTQMGHRPDICSKEVCNKFIQPYIKADIIKRLQGKFDLPLPEKKIEPYYGLGWRILKSKDHKGKDLVFHSGYINGVRSFIGYMPALDIGIIILANQDTKFPVQQGLNFWKIGLKEM